MSDHPTFPAASPSVFEQTAILDAQAKGCCWYYRDLSAQSRTVLVFIHGILSNNRECWTSPESGKSWPGLVAADHKLGCPDIYLAGYHSMLTSGSFASNDSAITISNSLANDNVLDYDRIVFVCHSQGGIVARRLVLKLVSRLQSKRVGLFLCASPSWGSHLGSKLSCLCKLIGFEQGVRLAYGDPTLMELDRDFQTLMDLGPFPEKKWRPMGLNLLETRGVLFKRFRIPIMPVRPDSASRYYPWEQVADSTHTTIVKPEDTHNQSHVSLVNFCQTKLLVTAHLVPKHLEELISLGHETLRVCGPQSKASRDDRFEILCQLKDCTARTLDVIDRNRTELIGALQTLLRSTECDPYQAGKFIWPLVDVSELQLSNMLNETLPASLKKYV